MTRILILLVCVMLAGCDYTVPLVTAPETDIDKALVGLWQTTNGTGNVEHLLVLPLGSREYLVSYPAGSKGAMFARGCLWRGPDLTLVQLDWFGTAEGDTPDDNRTFQFAKYNVEGDMIRIRLLNADAVNKEAASPEELAKAIAGSMKRSDLFREETIFTQIKPEAGVRP